MRRGQMLGEASAVSLNMEGPSKLIEKKSEGGRSSDMYFNVIYKHIFKQEHKLLLNM